MNRLLLVCSLLTGLVAAAPCRAQGSAFQADERGLLAGELDDVSLASALLDAARVGEISLVVAPQHLEALRELRVTARFQRARAEQVVWALLELYGVPYKRVAEGVVVVLAHPEQDLQNMRFEKARLTLELELRRLQASLGAAQAPPPAPAEVASEEEADLLEEATPPPPAPPAPPTRLRSCVGQRLRFALQGKIEMVWQVLSTAPDAVTYRVTTLHGDQPIGEPTEQTWRLSPAAQAGAPSDEAERAQLSVSGFTFECVVARVGTTRTWVSVSGDMLAFPGVLQVQDGDEVLLKLVEVSGP